MSKLATLFKQIEVFEKVATQGFFNKISQKTPDEGTALESYKRMEAGANSVMAALDELHKRTNAPGVFAQLNRLRRVMPADGKLNIDSAKVLMDTVQDIEMALAQEDYNTYSSTIREISSIGRQMNQNFKTINWVASQSMSDLKAPAAEPTVTPNDLPNAPAKRQLAKIDDDIQKDLNYLGYPNKLDPDGILGPETMKAIEWFRDTFKVPPAIKGEALYAAIKSEYRDKLLNRDSPDLTDAAKQNENLGRFPKT